MKSEIMKYTVGTVLFAVVVGMLFFPANTLPFIAIGIGISAVVGIVLLAYNRIEEWRELLNK